MINDEVKWVDDTRNSISCLVHHLYKTVNDNPRMRCHNIWFSVMNMQATYEKAGEQGIVRLEVDVCDKLRREVGG